MGLPDHKKSCALCGTIFRVWPSLENKRKYCSRVCQGKANSIQAHQERLIRLELIRNGADLPRPRRSAKHKYIPDHMMADLHDNKIDDIPDPDEPTPEEQEEITKLIKLLKENRRACENQLDTAFHKK